MSAEAVLAQLKAIIKSKEDVCREQAESTKGALLPYLPVTKLWSGIADEHRSLLHIIAELENE